MAKGDGGGFADGGGGGFSENASLAGSAPGAGDDSLKAPSPLAGAFLRGRPRRLALGTAGVGSDLTLPLPSPAALLVALRRALFRGFSSFVSPNVNGLAASVLSSNSARDLLAEAFFFFFPGPED